MVKQVQVKIYEHYQEMMIPYAQGKYLSYDTARYVLGLAKVPKVLRMIVISEMIEYKYLERINQRELKIV